MLLALVLIAPELGDEHCYRCASAREAVSDDPAVELLAILAAFGPPGLQIRLVGVEHPGAFGHGFAGRTFLREGVLTCGSVGDP